MHTLQKLLILLKSKDIKVSAKGESLVVDAPPGVLDNELAEEIRKHKSELISLFSNHQTDNKIIPTTNKARIALSAGQRRIWELAQLNPGSSQYNIPTVFKVIGRLDLAQLIKSVEKVCDNNRIFQNCIVNSQNDGAPLIKQVESFKMPYRHVDINELITKNDDVDRVARKYCDDFTQENFEFKDNLPLWRWTTVRVNDDCHYIAFVMHHIIFDGLSKVIFLKELSEAYNFKNQNTIEKIQFIDFLAWENVNTNSERNQTGINYWTKKLAGLKQSLVLPHDLAQTQFKNTANSIQFSLNDIVYRGISDAAGQYGANNYHILLAGLFLTLNRYTHQENMMICTPSANRIRSETENLVGYFNNILPIFIKLSKNQTLQDLVSDIKESVIKAYDHQSISLGDIAKFDNLRTVSFRRAMMSYQSSFSNVLALNNLEVSIIPVRKNYADFDLACYFEESDQKIICNLDYNCEIFSPQFITRFINKLAESFMLIKNHPNARISDIKFFGTSIKQINKILSAHPQIDESLVIYDQGLSCNVAYVVLNEHTPPNLSDILTFLSKKIPAYSVPKIIIPIDQFPLQSNGDIDIAALPAASMSRERLKTKYTPPSTDLEKNLCNIWQKVLWLNFKVGIEDQFIDLGGHSLLSVLLIQEIEKQLQLKVPSLALTNLSTIKQFVLDLSKSSLNHIIDYKHASLLESEVYMGLKSHTSSWVGHRHLPDSIMVGLNTDGIQTPIFWCLQRYQELQQLAKYLGPTQPVYGMRSGNRVMIKDQKNIERLANFYVQEILDTKVSTPYIIGGNCQAALIAFQIARRLQQLGKEVKLLILQEKFAPFSYSGRVSLLFGERSSYHPKFSYVMPQMGWRKYYTNYLSMTTIAGGHGEFFKEPNILSLTSAISKQIQLANNDSFDENIPKQPNTLQILGKPAYEYQISYPETLEAKLGETLNVSISFKNMSPIKWLPHNSSGIALYARWFTSSNTFLKHDGYMPLKDSVSSQETLDTHLHLVAPSQLGSFILQFDLVDEGVSWFRDKSPCIRVNVNP